MELKENIAKRTIFIPVIVFIILMIWGLFFVFTKSDPNSYNAQFWSAIYQIIAWFGVFYGIYFSNLWGGWKSQIGRANLAFASGLLAQSFGQFVFSYFTYKQVEVLYPSIADIGFFGSIPLYICGIYFLYKALRSRNFFSSWSIRILALLIPVCILGFSYNIFLKGYQFDWSHPLTIFFDFGYPLGQAIYVSMAIITFITSSRFLGGIMKKPVLFFIVALFAQFVADYVFLFLSNRNFYIGSNIIFSDLLYLLAYFMMTLSLIKLGSTFYKIKNS